jgi:hypothetical protein
MKKPAEPRISVFCKCGCQWHGRYATAKNPWLSVHVRDCGPPVEIDRFRELGFTVKFPPWWDK